MSAQPEKVFQHGAVRASVFVNDVSSNGKSFQIPKVSVQKRYRDKQGQWQNSSTFDLNDLPKIVAAVNKAYDHLTSKEEEAS